MSDKTPITDAVAEAQDWDMRVWWDLTIPRRDGDGGSRTAIKAQLGDAGPEFHHVGQGAPWSYQPTTPADAASALRLVADALSRDPARRALEIAADGLAGKGCPHDLGWDGCADGVGESTHCEEAVECWIEYWMEQAEEQLAAENTAEAAAEPEELVLTDDMLERMRKRCIHGR